MKQPFLGCCVNLQAHQFRFLQRQKKIQTNTLNQLRFFALSFMHSLVYSSETLSIILCPHWKPRGYGDPLMSGFRVLEGRFAHPSSINCYITCRTCKTATFANIQKPALRSTNWAQKQGFQSTIQKLSLFPGTVQKSTWRRICIKVPSSLIDKWGQSPVIGIVRSLLINTRWQRQTEHKWRPRLCGKRGSCFCFKEGYIK